MKSFAYRQEKILEHLKKRDPDGTSNIIHIRDFFYFRNHLCITFELLSINLYEFIKNNNFQGVSLRLVRGFAVQILMSLRFMRQERIIHCDLKPENILLKQPNKSGIKVIDLGSRWGSARVRVRLCASLCASLFAILCAVLYAILCVWHAAEMLHR